MTTIVQTFSGLAHKSSCKKVPTKKMRTMTGRWVMQFTVIAPDVDDAEAFIRARDIEACGICWPGLRARIAAEKVEAHG